MEPISLSELKLHLRLNTESISGAVSMTPAIVPASYSTGTVTGAGVSIEGFETVVFLEPGTIPTGGIITAKIQHSDLYATGYTDWTGGAFTVATPSNNSPQEIAYTGSKPWIRVVAVVAGGPIAFGVSALTDSSESTEDSLLEDIIETGRHMAEVATSRVFMIQEKTITLSSFPSGAIELPYGNLQTVESIIYKDSDGLETELIEDSDFVVETNGLLHGRVMPTSGNEWPTVELYPANPITITFTCGYGSTQADIPKSIKTLIKMICADLYESRGEVFDSKYNIQENKTVQRLIGLNTLWCV